MSVDWITLSENMCINKDTYAMSHFNQSWFLKPDNDWSPYSIINADFAIESRCVYKCIYIITLTMLTVSSHIFPRAFTGIVSNEVSTYSTISARFSFTFIYIWGKKSTKRIIGTKEWMLENIDILNSSLKYK